MTIHLDSRSLAVLLVRSSLALYLAAAGLALVTGNTGGAEPPWLPVHSFGPLVPLLGVSFLAAAALLATGYAASVASMVVAALLIAILVAWLIANPLHNTMNHLVPFMAATLMTFAASRDRFRFDDATRASVVVLFARLFLGSIFVAQGTRSMLKSGLVAFAQKLYVDKLAESWVPEPLLWIAGLSNPIVQVTTGVLLILGLRTRAAAAVIGAFLISIFFGHLMMDPFDRGDSTHAYAMGNFFVAIVILWLHPRGDRFSIDALLSRAPREAAGSQPAEPSNRPAG